ncbi:MAG: Ig-like domain-containing protein [Verrucomicrobiota bacterium]
MKNLITLTVQTFCAALFLALIETAAADTTLVSSQNPSLVGGAVTFTATVAGSNSLVPTGTITFLDGTNALGMGMLNSSAVANFSTAALAVTNPPHSIAAVYSGDTNFSGSTSAILLQTVSGPSSVPISNPSFENPVVTSPWYDFGHNGQNATTAITGWIINSSGGSFDGGTAGVENPSELGVGTAPSGNQVGYINGDQTASGLTSVAQQLAATLQTNTTYVLSIAVVGLSGVSIGTNFTIGLYAGGTVGQDSPLAGATQLTSVIPLTPPSGSWQYLNAIYGGGSGAALGEPLDILVGVQGTTNLLQLDFDDVTLSAGIVTTTSLSSSQDSSSNGVSVNFTATVSAPTGSSAPTSGTVTFMDGNITLGTGALNGSNIATFSTSALSLGAHTITAVYGGGGNYGGSISPAVSQDIYSALDHFAISAIASPQATGVPFIITTITAQDANDATVTGFNSTVTFGGTAGVTGTSGPFTSGVLSNASVTPAAPGNNESVTVSDGAGDTGLATIATVEHFVVTNPPVTLVSSQNPSLAGGAVTFTATVSAYITPTGTITYLDGSNFLGTGTLNSSGAANFSTAALAVTNPPHSITAVYGGDTNFSGSTSAILLQTVSGPSSISINNPSFENPAVTSPWYDYGNNSVDATTAIAGWIINASGGGATAGSAGVENPSRLGIGTAPNGNQVAYINGDQTASGLTSVAQQLAATLQTNATYVLSMAVVGQSNVAIGTNYIIGLYAGGSVGAGSPLAGATLLAAVSPVMPPIGGWQYLNAIYGGGSGAALGEPLDILVGVQGTTNLLQLDFDDVTLSAGIATTTSLSSSQDSSGNGVSVNFTATVSAPTGSSAPTSGTVTFMAGPVTLGTGTLNGSNGASFSTSALSLGAHTITAVYGGGGDYGGSISSPVTQTIYGALDHFAISAIASPQTVGVPFAIPTITAQDANGATVTGFNATVTFGGTAGVTGASGPFTSGVLSNASVTPTVEGTNETVTVSDGAGHTGSATIAAIRPVGAGGLNQTITFGGLTNQTYGAAPYSISATASSGLPVSFSVVSGPASVVGSNVTITAAGIVLIQASQPGNTNYNAATPVTNSFTVNPLAVILAGTRAYDGTANATNSILTVTDKVGTDDVRPASGDAVLAGSSVGTQAIVSFSGLVLGGVRATNYTLMGASGAVTITNAFNPFSIVSASIDHTGTNVVVCWQSVPGVVYNVLTDSSLRPPQSWAGSGTPVTASNTITCYTLSKGMTNGSVFVVIKQ